MLRASRIRIGTTEAMVISKNGRLHDVIARNQNQSPQIGQVYCGTLLQHLGKANLYKIDLGHGLQAVSKTPPPSTDGSFLCEITAIPAPPKVPSVTILHAHQGQKGLIRNAPSLEHFLLEYYGENITPDDELDDHLRDELDHLAAREVPLREGVSLIFDKTAAAHVIDVNSTLESGLTNANIKAAEEAARQIRCRNLSGIILIDFINMQHAKARQSVMAKLRSAFADDPAKPVIHGFTKLGLIEITRKRIDREWSEVFN